MDRTALTELSDLPRQGRRRFLKHIATTGAVAAAGAGARALPAFAQEKPEQPAAQGPQRYKLDGRVVSVEPAKQQVVVDAKDIPGFMMAMTMGYAVKNPNLLTPLSPEDRITADVVVNGSDVYLENIVVVKKADNAKAPGAGSATPDASQPGK